jgi:hypothetical protein
VECGIDSSDAEFDRLQAQKDDIFRKKMEARARLTQLAWELLAVQKEQDALDKDLARVHAKQEQIIEQEARALEELDTFTGLEPAGSLALMSDDLFSWGDFDKTVGQVPDDTPLRDPG